MSLKRTMALLYMMIPVFWAGGCTTAEEKPFLEITPSSVSLRPGENQGFIATFSDSGQPANAIWSVNGTVGGDIDDDGSITSNGTYAAPASLPDDDRVLISASASGADPGNAVVFLTTFDANQRITDYAPASFRADSRSSNQNALAVSGNNVYIVWNDNRTGDYDIYLSRSTNGGVSFDAPVRVNGPTTSGDQEHPSLAVNPVNGDVYVVWEDGSALDRDIYVARSTDGGTSFSSRVLVDSDSSDQTLPTIAIAGDGSPLGYTLYIAWEDNQNPDHTDSDVCLTASTDGGAFFETKLLVADVNVPREMRSPTLFINTSGNVSLIWEDHTNFYATLQLSRISREVGTGNLQASTPATIVSGSNTSQVHPSVAVDGLNRIYVVWERAVVQLDAQTQQIVPTRYDIYLTTSSDDGTTFTTPIPVNHTQTGEPDERTGFYGGWVYPDITADTLGNIYVVWEDSRNGFLTPDIYYSKSSDGGNPDSYETARKVNIEFNPDADTLLRHEKPSIGLSNSGKALVVWTDFRNNSSQSCNPCNNDIYFSREP